MSRVSNLRDSFNKKEKREPPPVTAAKPTNVTVHSSAARPEQSETTPPAPPSQPASSSGPTVQVQPRKKGNWSCLVVVARFYVSGRRGTALAR